METSQRREAGSRELAVRNAVNGVGLLAVLAQPANEFLWGPRGMKDVVALDCDPLSRECKQTIREMDVARRRLLDRLCTTWTRRCACCVSPGGESEAHQGTPCLVGREVGAV